MATALAGLLAFLVLNTLRSDSQDTAATTLSTSSLLTIPSQAEPTATPVPTTAPIQVPTSTPEPTATPLPTATAAPAPTATAAPTSTAVPPTPVPPEPTETPDVAVADAGAVASAEVVAATPEPEPTATLVPEPTATATPEPTPTIVEAVPNPTPQSTVAPTTEPTATVEPTVPAFQTAADQEIYVLGEVNKVRAAAGLSPLTLDPSVSEIARDWSQQMASGGFFEHRPGAQLNQLLPQGWQRWGENIASAPDIFWAESSLEASPGHYENMVGPFTHVGIGVVTNGSQVWLTQVFVRY